MPFRDVIGHTRMLALLSRAVAHDALPPSLLLAGPAGVGKRRTAGALAEALNCLEPMVAAPDGTGGLVLERDACGACVSCRRIARGIHPDVIVLAPGDSGSIKLEPVRDMLDRTAYRPFEGRRRVVIIDEADALIPQAQNALLKTLEEPPSASVLVLVSSLPDALLATVRSRCPRLRFGPLSAADVTRVLVRDHGYDESDARTAAADADGSVGRAREARSADISAALAAARTLLAQAARVSDPARRIEVVKDLAGKKTTPGAERDQLAVCLRVLGGLLRDLGILASQADPALLANGDLRAELGRFLPAFDAERSSRAFAAVDRALAALERNANPKVVADWLVLQL